MADTSYAPRSAASAMYPRSSVTNAAPVQQMQNVGQAASNTVVDGVNEVQKKAKQNGIWSLIILIIVITLVFMVLFWLLKLPIILTTNAVGAYTSDVSFWKLFGSSFVAALIVVGIIWGVSKITGRK